MTLSGYLFSKLLDGKNTLWLVLAEPVSCAVSAAGCGLVVAGGISLRAYLLLRGVEVQTVVYWTIIGRIDQFALGMLAFHFRSLLTSSTW